MLFE
jgi:hypothetical protein